ncbi:putative cation efflux pump (Multidrug resistance protein) [[Clostridium] ultunense Esp]|uniref:MATE family efflux transporter n=1 Tax=Thermicanus aegyptius TaxID=94009 RepID=UPI0002B70BBC|nr:MATE family efflux transporter [Thermicanus aegyptius]CCQ96253.1 putative cation efflux pump (Multidrug resistance protein) [[Clostridium] ultunense Esp]
MEENAEEKSRERKAFFHTMLSYAVPITVQTLIISSLNMIDTLMVGQLGVDSIAAVGVSNKITSILNLVLQGFASGALIFSSQYWGQKDKVGISKVFVITFLIVTLFSLLFTAIIFLFPHQLIRLFTDERQVIQLAAGFIRILSFSYLLTAFTVLFSAILKSMGIVQIPMYISVFAILLNTALNYVLIFGHFGMQALGIDGAAIATVVARLTQSLMLFLLLWKNELISMSLNLKWKELFNHSLFHRFFAITAPSVLNHILWTLGETAFFWIYAQMGTEEIAAVTLIDPLTFVFMALFIGVGDASAVMVGNSIGAQKKEMAYLYAKRFLALTLLLSLLAGVGILLISPRFISLYNISAEVASVANNLLMVYSLILTAKMLNMVNNIGVLRAGGDTKFVLYLDVLGVWLVGIPLAALSAYLHAPIDLVFALANFHELVRAFFGIKRTLTQKWINHLI